MRSANLRENPHPSPQSHSLTPAIPHWAGRCTLGIGIRAYRGKEVRIESCICNSWSRPRNLRLFGQSTFGNSAGSSPGGERSPDYPVCGCTESDSSRRDRTLALGCTERPGSGSGRSRGPARVGPGQLLFFGEVPAHRHAGSSSKQQHHLRRLLRKRIDRVLLGVGPRHREVKPWRSDCTFNS